MAPGGASSLAFGIAGSVTTTLMYASPLQAVWMARNEGNLGAIEARPFAFSVLCSCAWMAYGFVVRDVMLFQPNITGLVVSLFCAVASYGLADKKAQDFMLAVLCFTALFLPILGVMTVAVVTDHARAVLMWGLSADIITVAYYGSPLAAAWRVIQSRDSAAILLPRLLCDIANSGLWTVYGIMAKDPFIIVPNAIGVCLALCLAALKAVFWRRNTAPVASDSAVDVAAVEAPRGGKWDFLSSRYGALRSAGSNPKLCAALASGGDDSCPGDGKQKAMDGAPCVVVEVRADSGSGCARPPAAVGPGARAASPALAGTPSLALARVGALRGALREGGDSVSSFSQLAAAAGRDDGVGSSARAGGSDGAV